MHIMVNKRYMWRLDTCAGHEALIIKLLVKKPPGIKMIVRAALVKVFGLYHTIMRGT